MRRLVLGLMVAVALFQVAGCASGKTPASSDDLRVMTFNIRLFTLKDGLDGWPFRKDMLFRTIEKFDPDLLGLQEVLLIQREELKGRLKAYESVGVGRNDGKNGGEHALVMFKRERFEKVREGNFWLSETPEKVGSKGWDADLPRICSWVQLRDKRAGGRELVFFNTHFDHIGKQARVESAKLIRRKIEEIGGDKPVVITGDFNLPQDSPPYVELLRDRFKDAWAEVHPQPTTQDFTAHSFTGKNPRAHRIDWIVYSAPHFQTKSADINRTSENGRYPSDHFPVQAVLQWRE